MVWVGRDLCGSSSPTPLPKQGHPEQAAQDHVQAGREWPVTSAHSELVSQQNSRRASLRNGRLNHLEKKLINACREKAFLIIYTAMGPKMTFTTKKQDLKIIVFLKHCLNTQEQRKIF